MLFVRIRVSCEDLISFVPIPSPWQFNLSDGYTEQARNLLAANNLAGIQETYEGSLGQNGLAKLNRISIDGK